MSRRTANFLALATIAVWVLLLLLLRSGLGDYFGGIAEMGAQRGQP